jgi:hypothetical protein
VEFTNIEATDNIVGEVSQIVQGKQSHPPLVDHVDVGTPPGTRPAEVLEKYRGKYYSSEIDTEYEVRSEGRSLVIKRPGSKERPAYPDCALADDLGPRDDTFFARRFTAVLPETSFTFVRKGNGDIDYLRLDWSGEASRLMDFRFERRK